MLFRLPVRTDKSQWFHLPVDDGHVTVNGERIAQAAGVYFTVAIIRDNNDAEIYYSVLISDGGDTSNTSVFTANPKILLAYLGGLSRVDCSPKLKGFKEILKDRRAVIRRVLRQLANVMES
jgi:hypothetical protein